MTVNVDGDARDVEDHRIRPAGPAGQAGAAGARFAVFRPQMEDGSVVPNEDVQFRHDFRYPQPAPAAGQSPVPASRESAGEKGAPIHYPDQPDERDGKPKP